MSRQVITVGQINEYLRSVMDRDPNLQSLAIRGELSNYKVYPSGHHYFTLKDENGSLKCVMFRGSAGALKFRPENGMKVVAMGRITVFPRDGAYQLYCTAMIPDGVGDLYIAFEQLKKKLHEQGLFDPAHKKPIPKYPGSICIITSGAGAAVHDMLRVLGKRYPLANVRLLPVRVQGAEAPEEIASAIRYANYYQLGDLLIVGRGGGSMEDLWCFNDERVARAIYDSEIPVISAVGHEPDVTISDYVADLRAATPSNGAELAVPDREALQQSLDGMLSSMQSVMLKRLTAARRHLQMLSESNAMKGPEAAITIRRNNLIHLSQRLFAAEDRITARKRMQFSAYTAKLDALSPLKVLSRGYAITQKEDGSVVRAVSDATVGDRLTVTLADGRITACVEDVKENENGEIKL